MLEEGEEFQLVVLSGKDFHRFSITPDVDGLYVASDGSPNKERKLDRTDALALLEAAGRAFPAQWGEIRQKGTQKGVIDRMQTRMELYDVLGYHEYEKKLDELFTKGE